MIYSYKFKRRIVIIIHIIYIIVRNLIFYVLKQKMQYLLENLIWLHQNLSWKSSRIIVLDNSILHYYPTSRYKSANQFCASGFPKKMRQFSVMGFTEPRTTPGVDAVDITHRVIYTYCFIFFYRAVNDLLDLCVKNKWKEWWN